MGGSLELSDDDKINLGVIAGYIVGIAILWNVPYLCYIIYPFKLATIILHEFGHAIVGKCTRAKIEGIEVHADEGGVTKMRGGIRLCTLPAGYLGSSFFGALLVFAGFDNLASKIAACILGAILLVTLFWADNWLLRILTVFFVGMIPLLWWVPGDWEGTGLRYFVLFMGVMSCMYSLWDIIDDLIRRKVKESDAYQFADVCPICPARGWGVIWFFISLAFLAGGVTLGIYTFDND
eukprot:Nk52_evm6s371 gene=Nk52_evmTU6s371